MAHAMQAQLFVARERIFSINAGQMQGRQDEEKRVTVWALDTLNWKRGPREQTDWGVFVLV